MIPRIIRFENIDYIEKLEYQCNCKMIEFNYSLMERLDRFVIYAGTNIISTPITGNWFTPASIKDMIQRLKWDIDMYKKLIPPYKNKQYLVGTFKVSLESATKDLRELRRYIYSRYYIHQNSEDTSSWD